MPRRADIDSILVIGSGPIVIGQACEFDYSGTQACKVLKELGYRIVLLNSNPATIMTDPDLAHATYVEPLSLEFARKVIERERPDALLPTVGGQTALNLAMELHESGVLDEFDVELIGARPEAIKVAEDRLLFKQCVLDVGLSVPASGVAHTMDEAMALLDKVGLPAIIRPSFTLGGQGGGVAYNVDEFRDIIRRGLDLSPVSQILVEASILGWKEFELEVIRDRADNAIIICSIENFDPMGVHTGDSITVAPAQTLTDREYQELRNQALLILRAVGVETGGSNVQFAVSPETGEIQVIEMNPRVSRSSALASKATGFPIAKIAAQLAVGLTLDEITNDITRKTLACFEPTLDYVVVKVPRWNFEKFPDAQRTLGTSMKSVGEVMGLGRTFAEALLKAISSLEGGYPEAAHWDESQLRARLAIPSPDRMSAVFEAIRRNWDPSQIHQLTGIDCWFLYEMRTIVAAEQQLDGRFLDSISDVEFLRAKRLGMPDEHLARILATTESAVKERRESAGILPVFKRVDTCAAEFESFTPYLYSTYEEEDEAGESPSEPIIIFGNGPNRIGQGLEFDYCCCHAAYTVREAGFTSVMINNNPETVSTDYDTSDKLYFEPVTCEHVANVLARETPRGVILQFGGQTPLKLSHQVGPILGTSADAIDLCEDRERFNQMMDELEVRQPEGAIINTRKAGLLAARRIGFPLLVRPSYVLGGRAMTTCYDEQKFSHALDEALTASAPHPVLLDHFLECAIEYDVDAMSDGTDVYIAGILEHIEEAGIHSGDSATVLPPIQLSDALRAEMIDVVTRIARRLHVVGMVNVQFAVKDQLLYVLEVNPRASRTVPFISKARGLPLPALATRLCLGERLADLLPLEEAGHGMYFIKAPVFPWRRFDVRDVVLGPEMKSTGEVMGVGHSFGEAYAKALLGAGLVLPEQGGVFISVRDAHKPTAVTIARQLHTMGFSLLATRGTHRVLSEAGIPVEMVFKVNEGRPDIVDHVRNGRVQLMINTPLDRKSVYDEESMRLAGLRFGIPCVTSITAANALVEAIRARREGRMGAIKLQDLATPAQSRTARTEVLPASPSAPPG
ncbi:MAG: carbamoyl-phosphate synthase large subunit [Myxococcota bacterium]|jgi:carbamoyl-phosphate synthase large subunit|nr:carbamoyl-phosphate synthase large subunit [Myxococcota bacterium]